MYTGVIQAIFHLYYRQTQGLISQLGQLVRIGEYVNCRLFGNMVNEVKRKFWVYNLLITLIYLKI